MSRGLRDAKKYVVAGWLTLTAGLVTGCVFLGKEFERKHDKGNKEWAAKYPPKEINIASESCVNYDHCHQSCAPTDFKTLVSQSFAREFQRENNGAALTENQVNAIDAACASTCDQASEILSKAFTTKVALQPECISSSAGGPEILGVVFLTIGALLSGAKTLSTYCDNGLFDEPSDSSNDITTPTLTYT